MGILQHKQTRSYTYSCLVMAKIADWPLTLLLSTVTASYGSVGARAASAVDLESYPPLPSTARSRSRALILGFATLLLTGVAVIGYASQQHVRQVCIQSRPCPIFQRDT